MAAARMAGEADLAFLLGGHGLVARTGVDDAADPTAAAFLCVLE